MGYATQTDNNPIARLVTRMDFETFYNNLTRQEQLAIVTELLGAEYQDAQVLTERRYRNLCEQATAAEIVITADELEHLQEQLQGDDSTKTRSAIRRICILPELQAALDELLPQLEPGTYIIGNGNKPLLSVSAYNSIWKRIEKEINLHSTDEQHTTAHVFRHTWVTNMPDVGMNPIEL